MENFLKTSENLHTKQQTNKKSEKQKYFAGLNKITRMY